MRRASIDARHRSGGSTPMSLHPEQAPHVVDRAVLEAEVDRIVEAAEAAGATVRVLGSIGVALHCRDAADLLPRFARTYADIDFAGYRRQARIVSAVLTRLGYREDREVTIATEGRRGLFDQPDTGIHVDVFFDRLEFCHPIPLNDRLERDRPTIPLAELLLSKLQIVRINEKDVIDVILLLLDHPFADGDGEAIDAGRVARLCATDWGLWRTATLNLDKVRTLAAAYGQLDDAQRTRVADQVAALEDRIEREPKSLGWRTRARIGERRQWWTDVEEVRPR